jgi:hypothetical protein
VLRSALAGPFSCRTTYGYPEVTPVTISGTAAPALGDVRAAAYGETIWLKPGATKRKDWPRYMDALTVALTRGVDVRWVR